MGSQRQSLLLRALGAVGVAACLPARANEALDLLARGACTAAAKSAQQMLAGSEHDGDAAVADTLAINTRIALDCRRPETIDLASWLDRELALRVRLDGEESAAAAKVALEQVRRNMQLNRLDEADAALTALDARNEKAHWPADVAARIADARASLHNLRAEAEPAYETATRAIALARTSGDDTTLIHALENQAFARIRQRRGADAMAPLAEADRIVRERFGENNRERAETLRFTGQALRDAGNHGAAIDAFEQSLANFKAQQEIDEHQIAVTTLNLAQTLKISGDLDRAEARYEEALAADARAPDPARRTRPPILHGLANVLRDRNQHARAVTLYAQALPLFEDVYGKESPQLAQMLNNYANAQANLGHYEDAIRMYRRALAIADVRKSSDPGDYLPLANIAMIDVWQGHHAAAEAGFRKSIEHSRGTSAGSEASTLFSRIGLAASLWGQRRYDDAFAAAVAAEETREAALRLAASRLGERQSINFQEYQRVSLDFVLAIAAASGKPAHVERAWELAMAARDQVTSITAQRLASARASTDPELAPLWNAWREASGALALAELDIAAETPRIQRAQENVDRAERALATAMPLGTAMSSANIGFAELRKSLPADTALVLFSPVQPRVPEDFSSTAAETRAPDVYAWILASADAGVRVVKIGAADDIARRIAAWEAAQSDPRVALAEVARRGAAAREAIWTPLARAIGNKRVLVVPTGALHRMAWNAMPHGKGYLLDAGYSFHALNHERELTAAPTSAAETTGRLLAVADPSISATPATSTRACANGVAISPLPGARHEAERIGARWRQRFGSEGSATILEGTSATEARVRAAAGDVEVLHFATHGLELGGACATTSAIVARGFALAADAPLDDAAAPASAAALLLAPGDAPGDDGLLTAQEIASLDLSHTRLAVLAACTTAAGTTRHYEGLFGLARAFRLAGVRTTITSLWPVEDAATAEWSEALYAARLDRGLDTAQSLADAQRTVLAARRARGESTHPYYWAAFVASGDWR